jgi:hypothetical protein
MAGNEAKISLTAVDETRAAFASVATSLGALKTQAISVKETIAGLAVTGLLLGIAESIAGAVEAAASLDKLAQRTGIATDQLSQLHFAAKMTEVPVEALDGALKKLNVSISAGLAGEAKKVEMFHNLGVTLKDASGHALTADKVLLQLAETFGTAKDGAAKTAYAVGLMGKSGDEMIPLLNGGKVAIEEMTAKADKLGLTIGPEFAKQAAEFKENLTTMKAAGDKLAITLAGELVSGLGKAMKAMADATIEGGKLKGILAGIQTLLTGDDQHKNNVQLVEDTDRLLTLQNQLSKLSDKRSVTEKFQYEATKKAIDEVNARIKTTLAYRTELAAADEKAAAAAPKKTVELKPVTKEPKAGGSTANEYDALNKAIEKRLTLANQQLTFGDKLPEYIKQEQESLSDLWDAYTRGKITLQETVDLEAKVHDTRLAGEAFALLKSQEADAMEIAKEHQKLTADGYAEAKRLEEEEIARNHARLVSGKDMLETIEFETRALTMNAQERELATAEREMERQGILRGTQAWNDYHDAIIRATGQKFATQKQVDDFKQVWDSVDKTAHDAFVNIFEGGKSAFTKLRDTLKATLLDLLYQMTVRKWIFDISASVTGQSAGVAGAVANASNLGSAFSGASMLSGLASGGSFLTTAASAGGAGAAVNAATMTALGNTAGAASTAIGGLTTALGAIPVWGWAALGAAAIYSLAGKSHGPKQEAGYAPGGLSIAGADIGGNMQGSQRGDVASAKQYSDTVAQAYQTLATTLGLAKKSLDVGIFFSKDANGTSKSQLQVTSSAGYNRGALQGGIENVGRTDAEFQAAISAETSRVILDALKKSDLSQKYKDILNNVAATAGADEIQAAINQVTAAKTQQASLEERLYQLTATAAEKLTRTRDAERTAAGPLNAALLDQVYAQEELATSTAAATANLKTYQQNFYSADEQRSIAAQHILDQINAVTASHGEIYHLGDVLDASRESFRRLTDSIDTSTEYGKKLHDTMIGVSGEFAGISTNAAAATAAIASQQTAQATANTASDNWFAGQIALYTAQEQTRRALEAAWTNTANSIDAEMKRLRGEIAGASGQQSMAMAQTQFAIATAKARAGDKAAADSLPALSQQLQQMSLASASSRIDYITSVSGILGSLQQTQGAINPLAGIAPTPLTNEEQVAAGQAALNAYGVPGFAAGGSFAGGWAMVGENGPELAKLPASRIYNTRDTQAMLDGSGGATSAALQALEARLAKIEANTEAAATHTANSAFALREFRERGIAVLNNPDGVTRLLVTTT